MSVIVQPWRIRGGALSLTPTSPPLDSNFKSDNAHNHQRGMAAALFSTYFCVMGAKCALPSVLSLLLHPSTGLDFSAWSLDPQYLFSRQLTIATMSVAFGKLLLGPVIDAIGGIASLKIALTALCMLLLVIAQCNRFMTFAICWVFVDFSRFAIYHKLFKTETVETCLFSECNPTASAYIALDILWSLL